MGLNSLSSNRNCTIPYDETEVESNPLINGLGIQDVLVPLAESGAGFQSIAGSVDKDEIWFPHHASPDWFVVCVCGGGVVGCGGV